jgi:hypothetical protein
MLRTQPVIILQCMHVPWLGDVSIYVGIVYISDCT